MKSNNGTRMIEGREYLLNGTVSGNTPEDAKQNALTEAKRMRTKHMAVRIVRRHSFSYAMYTHG